jgi:hypothetical protein
MEWLQTHWMALVGIAILGWIIDRFLEMLTALPPRRGQNQPQIEGLVELVTSWRR